MSLTPNASYALSAHLPKKDAVLATGAPAIGDNVVAIWIGSAVPGYAIQSAIGTLELLHRYVQTEIHNLSGLTELEVPLGGNYSEIAAMGGGPVLQAGYVGLIIDDILIDKQQSHFIDRTFKRLKERLLEAAKGETAVVTNNNPTIASGTQSETSASFQFSGLWQPGVRVVGSVMVWDPDSQEDEQNFDITIPGGAPPEGWDAATAATVVAGVLDPMPHIRATVTGAVLTVTTADPDYTLAVLMSVEV